MTERMTVMVHTPTGMIECIDASDFREILRCANEWYKRDVDNDLYMQELIAKLMDASFRTR